ncbi:MAG: hypothetical protein AAFY71_00345 [Bacteroidota bacterium]
MKKLTYLIKHSETILVAEDLYDDENKVHHLKDYAQEGLRETIKSFDKEDRLVSYVEWEDGQESSRTVYTRDEQGRVVHQQLSIGGELYEEELTEYFENGQITRTLQDKVELHKVVDKQLESHRELCIYQQEELVERHVFEKDEQKGENRILYYDADGSLFLRRVETFNPTGSPLHIQELNERDEMIEEVNYTYEGNLLVKLEHKWLIPNPHIVKTQYSYDSKGNLLKEESRSSSDKLMGFRIYAYDRDNRVVEMREYQQEDMDTMAGDNFQPAEESHYRFEYLEE